MKTTAWTRCRVVLLLLSVSAASMCARPAAEPRLAVPVDPVSAILDAFGSYKVVAVGEGSHGNEEGHAFRLSLVRDPRFAATVSDIVVEFGNARYQDVIDRFVRGDEVSNESLPRIWQDTTQPFTTFDIPIYEEFFRAVRALNGSRPRDRQLRVLLGDPPIDWNDVHNSDEAFQWLAGRDTHPAGVIQREVLARDRRALVIYGDMHFQRKNLDFNYVDQEGPEGKSIVNVLETATKVFTVWTNTHADLATLQPNIAFWRKPSLAIVRGTVLGAADFTVYYPFESDRFSNRDGRVIPVPRDQWQSLRMEDQVDAVLYLGSPSEITYSKLSPTLCADSAYIAMRLGRLALAGVPTDGLPDCPTAERK